MIRHLQAFSRFLLATWVAISASTVAADGPYEEPPILRSADLLTTELLEGPHHKVDPEAPTDGFMAYFTIHSDEATYRAASVEETVTRVGEIYAIAALGEMKRYEVAGKTLVEGVKHPFLAVKSVATRPRETVQNVGESFGRWLERGKVSLRKAGRKARKLAEEAKDEVDEYREERRALKLAEQEVRDRAVAEGRDPEAALAEYRQRRDDEKSTLAAESDAERRRERIEWASEELEKAAYKHFGYDSARRQLARQLEVDPYSTNLLLQERLDEMAWAVWVGRLGTDWVLPSSQLLGYAQDVDELVWQRHPKDLEVRNRKLLKSMKVDGDLADAFYKNRLFSTSDRTHIIDDLASLDRVRDRSRFFRRAAEADHWRLGAYFRRSARLLARAHRDRPLKRIVEPGETLVGAISRDGELLLMLAVDHLAWTESIDLVFGGIARQLHIVGFDGPVVLVLSGGLTELARKNVEALGWSVESDPYLRPQVAR